MNDNSPDDTTVQSYIQSMEQSQPEDLPKRRRSFSMLEMNEIESIKRMGPITDHYIGHNHYNVMTDTGENDDGVNRNSDESNVGRNVTVYLENHDNEKIVFESKKPEFTPQSMPSLDSSDIDEKSLSSSGRTVSTRSILRSSLSKEISSRRSLSASFSTLEIREYPITLGDNPGGVNGPPISLDFNYSKRRTQIIALEDYETSRLPRRKRDDLRMDANMRTWMLLRERGLSLRDIVKATKMAESTRLQRKKSIQPGPISNLMKRFKRITSK
jgi:hypothetical protein